MVVARNGVTEKPDCVCFVWVWVWVSGWLLECVCWHRLNIHVGRRFGCAALARSPLPGQGPQATRARHGRPRKRRSHDSDL